METDIATASAIHPLDTPRPAAWEQDALMRFTARMLDADRPFPCVFGVDAIRRGTLRAGFIEPGDVAGLARALTDFTAVAETLGRRTSLVVFVRPEQTADDLSIDQYRARFWSLLQGAHRLDPHSWPTEIPTDTTDPSFEFSFAGTPMFVVANTPAHSDRASRFFEYFAITFQPRFVFDDITAHSTQGLNARKIIRARLREYDSATQTPLLGNFGEAGNQEWRQYFLEDHNEPFPESARCPFQVAKPESRPDPGPTFLAVPVPSLTAGLRDLLPEQGSIEVQHDQPGKTHDWHQHSVEEELFIVSGQLEAFWMNDDGEHRTQTCREGTLIVLPAGTRHGSIAGPEGVIYLIRPKGGRAAVTTFLDPTEYPVRHSPLPDAASDGLTPRQ